MTGKTQKKSVQIEVHHDESQTPGEYVNMARVFHNQTEFVVDAIFLAPGSKRASVKSRLILNPIHLKFLHAALGQNLEMYVKKFGKISGPTQGPGGGADNLH